MRDDIDSRVGEIFRRLSIMRLELGEGAVDRTLRDVLQTLGTAAHREAERRAQAMEERYAPILPRIDVAPFSARGQPEPFEEGSE